MFTGLMTNTACYERKAYGFLVSLLVAVTHIEATK